MRYVLTGGGTGGHVYPNLAIAGELARHDPAAQFLYLGVKGRAEADIVPRHGIRLRFVPSRGMPERKFSLAMVSFLFALAVGTLKALAILLRFRPHLVVATGGYASAPTLLAARFLRRRILVHEQNAYPGLVNRTFGKMAGRVCLTFPESLVHFQHNGVVVGYPVRPEILALREPISDEERRRRKVELGVEPHRAVVLITGGSSGARSINRAVADMMPQVAGDQALRDRMFIMHGVGRFTGTDYDAEGDTQARLRGHGFDERAAAKFYRRERYLYDIDKWLRIADVVICRAGAGSLTETAAMGAPAIVIPKAGLPGDHQVKNAEALRAAGACRVLAERRVTDNGEAYDVVEVDRLLTTIKELLDLSPDQKKAMADAAWRFIAPDCLARIRAEAQQLLAGPKVEAERLKRRRTFLVDAQGRSTELLFDRSRVGTGRWDDVNPHVAGLVDKHFWLKRSTHERENRIEEKWTVLPRAELKLRRRDEEKAVDLSGLVELTEGDRLILPGGQELHLTHEWLEVSRVKTEKGAVENIFSQGVGTLGSKLVGLLREAFLGRFFGAGNVMDVFAVSLMLANLMREVV
ncbi:MAG: glycosyltransferase, partial [Alphaproteobacteria bacterium]